MTYTRDQDVLVSLLGSCHVVHLYRESMSETDKRPAIEKLSSRIKRNATEAYPAAVTELEHDTASSSGHWGLECDISFAQIQMSARCKGPQKH